jgi:hypothetical protein
MLNRFPAVVSFTIIGVLPAVLAPGGAPVSVTADPHSALLAAHAVPPLVSDSRSHGLLGRLDSHVAPNTPPRSNTGAVEI